MIWITPEARMRGKRAKKNWPEEADGKTKSES